MSGGTFGGAGERSLVMQQMDNFTFGVTMLIVGMGGTIVTLWIMSLIMTVLMKVFPYKEEEQPK